MKKLITLALLTLLLPAMALAAPTTIKLLGTEGYSNTITMDVPLPIISSSAAFDTEHVYKVALKGTLNGASWTVFIYMKSFGAARPKDALNISADTNIQYYQSKNMKLLTDTIGRSANYGTYRDQVFGWPDGQYIFMRTFMLDYKHTIFVASIFDKDTTMKMFDSIVPGTSNSLFLA